MYFWRVRYPKENDMYEHVSMYLINSLEITMLCDDVQKWTHDAGLVFEAFPVETQTQLPILEGGRKKITISLQIFS